ncbi:MAG: glycosyltransferase family 2 protein [Candidatus Sumerlaeia bacterium]|nr:glycosyltransferase family 2 protein [Candidatus Sumerlaeia bacterium]
MNCPLRPVKLPGSFKVMERAHHPPYRLPITVIIPVRNEVDNLPACLRSVRFCQRVIVVDSGSTDGTVEVARHGGAEVHQFHNTGGWPKKRQWAMGNLGITTPWTFLLDADERVTRGLRRELAEIVRNPTAIDGYWVPLHLVFLGRPLRYGASGLRKLSFFRTGKGSFECLVADQDTEMADMEIHEHLVLDGKEGACRQALLHHNVNNLFRYIEKHNEYSSWSARVVHNRRLGRGPDGPARTPSLLGPQADRRRWMTNLMWRLPLGGFLLPILRFLWFYLFRLGFLDGRTGFYYCGFKAVQAFHIMAKLREIESRKTQS